MLSAPCPERFQILADVFISYARPDRETIERLAAALQMIELDVDKDKDTFFKIWSDIVPGIRQDPYFLTFTQNTGLLEYWQAHGWPDKCRPAEGGGFDCT